MANPARSKPAAVSRGMSFSQDRLQDYADCPRRFQLRHVLAQPWPALVTESPAIAEKHIWRGARLHHLIHQHALGVDAELLAATIQDELLARWWHNYLAHPPADLPHPFRRAECGLSAPIAGSRLVARLDLLAAEPGARAVVVDWKSPAKEPSRLALAQRMQTRLYRYLIVEAGAAVLGGIAPQPHQVEMVYWFAESGRTERFPYDVQQQNADEQLLRRMITEITTRDDRVWELAADTRRCRFCTYRSLCDRGLEAGALSDTEDDLPESEPVIELEQVAEVAF